MRSFFGVFRFFGVFTVFRAGGVVLVQLFGPIRAIKLMPLTGNGGNRKGEKQDRKWFHYAV